MTTMLVPTEAIKEISYFIRGQRVMIDSDLAKLYGVETRVLIQAVKRNIERFPEDFMSQITTEEWEILRSQIGISKSSNQDNTLKNSHGGRRTNPYVFTEHGILMLANVLNSKRAISVSIDIIRAFNHLRQLVGENEDIRKRLDEHDRKINVILNTINQMLAPPKVPKKPLGFHIED